jgi:hypothetical protein
MRGMHQWYNISGKPENRALLLENLAVPQNLRFYGPKLVIYAG